VEGSREGGEETNYDQILFVIVCFVWGKKRKKERKRI
jgi:hypothetical protein